MSKLAKSKLYDLDRFSGVHVDSYMHTKTLVVYFAHITILCHVEV